MTYVNYRGETIGLIDHGTRKKAKKDEDAEWHRGWRVDGLPPGSLEAAELQHPQLIAEVIAWNERMAKNKGHGKAQPIPQPWDAERWMNEAKKTPVRRKAYEIEAAARECAALAIKAGWLRVEVVELKKTKATA